MITRRRARGTAGFTMVELVMAISILGILATSIGVVGVVMFRTMNQTQARLDETHGPRFASVYWIPDVASAELVNPSGAVCGAAGPKVTLRWTDDRTGVTTVSYAVVTNTAGNGLVRRLCTNGSTTPVRTTLVAPNIGTPGAEVGCGNGTSFTPCSSNDASKSLRLTVTPKSGGGSFSIDAFREVT